MKKLIKTVCCVFFATLCASFVAVADTNDIGISIQQKHAELVKMCEYYPDECEITASGAGNGGGNEPPYTPRKPKKQPKELEKDT